MSDRKQERARTQARSVTINKAIGLLSLIAAIYAQIAGRP